jgi:hypothetical protein
MCMEILAIVCSAAGHKINKTSFFSSVQPPPPRSSKKLQQTDFQIQSIIYDLSAIFSK